ncbi:mCG1042868, isoform CRA_b [Mus musculus]|nr:mCG1042868, isoform CRA_b [Mus musculus]
MNCLELLWSRRFISAIVALRHHLPYNRTNRETSRHSGRKLNEAYTVIYLVKCFRLRRVQQQLTERPE